MFGMMDRSRRVALTVASLALIAAASAAAQDAANSPPAPRADVAPRAILRLAPTALTRAALQNAAPAAAAGASAGLRWLLAHQDQDGRWNAADFMAHDGVLPTDGKGRPTNDLATTGLALLALARDGVPAGAEPQHAAILRGAHWLATQQQDGGLLGTNTTVDFVYGHAIATLGLWAATAATGSAEARTAAENGISYLERHRNPFAVWRYQPRDGDNDTSVTTWAVLAYLAADELGHRVELPALAAAQAWLDAVTDDSGRSGYTKRGERSSRQAGQVLRFPSDSGEAMTAAALLIRMGTGQSPDTTPIMRKSADLLLQKPPLWDPATGQIDLCYWFFASEALRHFGGAPQKEWAAKLEAALVKGQRTDGAFAGSWDPIDPWGEDGGRIYATALSVIALQAVVPFAPEGGDAEKAWPK